MICSKCGKECSAKMKESEKPIAICHGMIKEVSLIPVSSCCGAKIDNNEDQMQGYNHHVHTSGAGQYHVAGYPRSEKTLRDEIAIAALTGILSNQSNDSLEPKEYAHDCYAIADAFMESRNK